MAIRVVLAEDHLLVREGVRRLLEREPEIEVAAVCGDLDSLLAAVESELPDVVVTDKARAEASPLNELTARERDVLREMAEGRNNAAIAQALFLTERSVEKVIHSIFLKLGIGWEPNVHKRVKAVILYLAGTSQ